MNATAVLSAEYKRHVLSLALRACSASYSAGRDSTPNRIAVQVESMAAHLEQRNSDFDSYGRGYAAGVKELSNQVRLRFGDA